MEEGSRRIAAEFRKLLRWWLHQRRSNIRTGSAAYRYFLLIGFLVIFLCIVAPPVGTRCRRVRFVFFYRTSYVGLTSRPWTYKNNLLTHSLYLIPFLRYLTSKFLEFDLDFWRSPEVKNIFTVRKPIHDFLSDFYWHFLSISYRFWDIWLQSFQDLTLIFGGHLRSKIFSSFKSPYMNTYLTSIDISLSRIVFEIFDFKVWFWMWMSIAK